jgi:deazaflavin-dependent oxidoreductase (nitroreductase family)
VPSDRTLAKISNSLGARGLRWTGKLNVPLYRLSGGRIGGKVGRAPVLLLTTTGRRSGEPRTAPVVYLADGENVVVIDTNAGNAKVPAWSLNLEASPEGEVELGRKRYPVRAPRVPSAPTSGASTTSSTPASTTTRRSSTGAPR